MGDHTRNNDRQRGRLLRPLALLGAVAVTTVAFVGGCSDEEPAPAKEDEPSAAASTATDERPLVTMATVGRVTGKLGDKKKQQMKADVTEVMDAFFDNGYLGDFPRSSFDKAYASFTTGARADARRDADLLSNAKIADRIDGATSTKRRVAIDVLAVKGKAQGVTARFTLEFDTSGELERTDRVRGYLLLDNEGDGWQVFGYDVMRSVIS
jgi:hypothetical protein